MLRATAKWLTWWSAALSAGKRGWKSKNNEAEQRRVEWVAAKNLAEAASLSTKTRKAPGDGNAKTRGRKREYADENELKKARADRAKQKREASKRGKDEQRRDPGQQRDPGHPGQLASGDDPCFASVHCEDANPSDGRIV